MLKTVSKLECKIGEKIYQFFADHDSPLVEVKEALFQFQKYVGQIEDQCRAQAAKKAEEEKAAQEQPKAE